MLVCLQPVLGLLLQGCTHHISAKLSGGSKDPFFITITKFRVTQGYNFMPKFSHLLNDFLKIRWYAVHLQIPTCRLSELHF